MLAIRIVLCARKSTTVAHGPQYLVHRHKSSDVILYLQETTGTHAHPEKKSQEHTTDASLGPLQIDTTEGDHKDKIKEK